MPKRSLIALILLTTLFSNPTYAQSLNADAVGSAINALSPDQINQVRDAVTAGQTHPVNPPVSEPIDPSVKNTTKKDEQQNDIKNKEKEHLFTGRGTALSAQLKTFGDSLMRGDSSASYNLNIPVPSDYRVGPGDNVMLRLFGKVQGEYTLPVSRDGSIQIPNIGPLVVSGLTFEDMSKLILQNISQQTIGVNASINMGNLRSIQISIVGEVDAPGAYTVSSLTTVTNAILTAGGVRPMGSLRKIEVRRNNQTITKLDLYNVLLRGDLRSDLRLQPGDVVFVPTAGVRVGISGMVNRPAIYELLKESSVGSLIELAGGLLPSAFGGGAKIYRLLPNDSRQVLDINIASNDIKTSLINGDILEIPISSTIVQNSIKIEGAVARPGDYAWQEGMMLTDVLSSPKTLTASAWRLLGIIVRRNAITGISSYQAINLVNVLENKNPMKLHSGDRVFVLDQVDVDYISSKEVKAALTGQPVTGTCSAITNIAQIVSQEGVERFRGALSHANENLHNNITCPALYQQYPELLSVVLEQAIVLRGEVKTPRALIAGPGVTLHEAIENAGGLTQIADTKAIELSRIFTNEQGNIDVERKSINYEAAKDFALKHGDMILVRKQFSLQDKGLVSVTGEVRNPGGYDIKRGEKLSQVLMRAGGLTSLAYPYGAIFQRKAVKDDKHKFYNRASLEVESALLLMMSRQGTNGANANPGAVSAVKGLAESILKIEPTGRIVVEADPTILQVRPELDLTLEPGDEIHIPKRPGHVLVMGEVLNAGALQFESGLGASDYIRLAGGISSSADESRAFIILPNGNAEAIKLSSWNITYAPIAPGSAIYVPRDYLPWDNLTIAQTALQILRDLAISTAAIKTINR